LEVTEVGEITEEHTENELEEGERTQEKNQGAQEYQEEEATPSARRGIVRSGPGTHKSIPPTRAEIIRGDVRGITHRTTHDHNAR